MYSTDWSMEELEVEDWASEQREIETMLYREEVERKRRENMSRGSGFSYPSSVCNYDPTDMLGNDDPNERSEGTPDWKSDEEEADWEYWVESVVASGPPRGAQGLGSPYASASAALDAYCKVCEHHAELCVCRNHIWGAE
jgi:hypothetical protein